MDSPYISEPPRADDLRSFRLLDLTLPSPAENLALDEVLLDELEDNGGEPILRFWESHRHFVVLGSAGRLGEDVHADVCERDGVPFLWRVSGGGTVLQGPGCLSYALVLPLGLHPALANIRTTNQFILDRVAKALHRWEPATVFRGISDLAIDGLKISGNAQCRKRRVLLFHGTILYGMHIPLITRYLKEPKRQPDYRTDRPHGMFLRTINALPDGMKPAIAAAWGAGAAMEVWPTARMSNAIATVTKRSSENQKR